MIRLGFKIDPVDRLLALLSEERRILLSGQLAELEGLAGRKEQLLGQLEQKPPQDDAKLVKLTEAYERNQVLLSAAADGVRHSLDRLRKMRAVRASLDTYDAAGKMSQKMANHARKLDGRR